MFAHHAAGELPELEIAGVTVRVIIGEAFEHASPVQSLSSTLYLECRLPEGTELELPEAYRELAAYVVSGDILIDQHAYSDGTMAVACPGNPVRLAARKDSLVMVIGGDPVGERHIWWNFVSSSKDRIEKAGADWKERRFDDVPGESEFIPLPE